MKWLPLKALLLCIALQTQVVAAEYKGAGSSISASLLKTWAISYNAKNNFNYESSSSKAGIEQLSLGKIDFAASDEALPLAELNAKHLIQFPFVMGAVVPVVNLPGVSDNAVILSPEILAGMYSGQIKRWRDPLILALNPELEGKMPDLPVLPIYRKSGSGTNFIFTSYLSRSPSWKNGKIGVSFDMIGASGQGEDSADAVLSRLQQTRGAVSYLDYARVQKNKLNATRLTGPLQMVVKVSPDNIRKAAHEVAEQSLYSRRKISINLVNIESTGWPMSNFTFLVMKENLPTEHRQAIVNFISWGFSKEGREIVQERGYIELSGVMQSAVRGFLGDAYKINLALN